MSSILLGLVVGFVISLPTIVHEVIEWRRLRQYQRDVLARWDVLLRSRR